MPHRFAATPPERLAVSDRQRRPRTRDPYAEVGQRTRQSIERALVGGATPAELAILQATTYWLTTFSRTTDVVSLGRLAQAAGLWDGSIEDCPRDIEKRVASRLRRLEVMGAVLYEPGGQGRGDASRLTLPALAEGSFLERGSSIAARAIGGSTVPPYRTEEGGSTVPPYPDRLGGQSEPVRGVESAPLGGSRVPHKGGRENPPHEDVPRTKSEEASEDTRVLDDLLDAVTVDLPSPGPPAGEAIDDGDGTGRIWDDLYDLYDLGADGRGNDSVDAGRISDWAHAALDRWPDVLDAIRAELHTRPPREVRLVMRLVRRVAVEQGIASDHLPRLLLPDHE
jgi:hypothetical protein